MWRRLPVNGKLFVVSVLTTTIVVAFMAVMMALSVRTGFTQHLLRIELARFDDLVEALSGSYDAAADGWPELTTSDNWNRFVRTNFSPRLGPGRRRPPPGAAFAATPDSRRPPPPVAGSRPPPPDPLQLGSRLALLAADGTVIAGQTRGTTIARRPISSLQGSADARTVGWLAIGSASTTTSDGAFLIEQFRILILTSVLAIIASALAAFFLGRQFLAPVQTLVDGTQALTSGDYTTRMDNTREDEFGELVEHFNELAATLEATQKAERQWLSDASHELQTPLAVLRAEIEALQDGIRKADQNTLWELRSSVVRLSQLVADLNALAQSREKKLVADLSREDLSAIVVDAIVHARPRLEKGGLELKASVQEDIVLLGDKLRLRQLIDNLIENSRRYTDSPGVVSVKLFERDNQVEICVEDTAPAPPLETLGKLFDRFFRVDHSRARHLGGSGLGLAICRAIVESHGGEITARHSPLGGLRVNVNLPLMGDHERAA